MGKGRKPSLKPEDFINNQFGKYIVLDFFRRDNGKPYVQIKCVDCSNIRVIIYHSLKRLCNTCPECRSNPHYKSNTYNSWDAMVQRTTNLNCKSYYKYGAIGITCCERWTEPDGKGFLNFLEDMGEAPEGTTLDRWPDKFGCYQPDNCRWATNSQQSYNQKKRNTNSSGKTGVCWDNRKGKWLARITFQNHEIHLGRFDSFEEAVKSREDAEIKYFGEIKE